MNQDSRKVAAFHWCLLADENGRCAESDEEFQSVVSSEFFTASEGDEFVFHTP